MKIAAFFYILVVFVYKKVLEKFKQKNSKPHQFLLIILKFLIPPCHTDTQPFNSYKATKTHFLKLGSRVGVVLNAFLQQTSQRFWRIPADVLEVRLQQTAADHKNDLIPVLNIVIWQ